MVALPSEVKIDNLRNNIWRPVVLPKVSSPTFCEQQKRENPQNFLEVCDNYADKSCHNNHCESKRVKLYGDSKKGVLLQFAKALVVIYT